MSAKKNRHLAIDVVIVTFSIILAITLSKMGIVHNLVAGLGEYKYIGALVSGFFFTSAFTTPASIALLSEFSQTMPPIILGVMGGFGAMLGDYILFRFMRDRVADDLAFLLSSARKRRFALMFKTRLFHFLLPFIGALIIISPFPDELGITLLGFSKLKSKTFLMISFIMNAVGIAIIGFIAMKVF
ncbi:MAG: hypothetical protein WCT02_03230 [Candidatus Paceibacterota bacterium]